MPIDPIARWEAIGAEVDPAPERDEPLIALRVDVLAEVTLNSRSISGNPFADERELLAVEFRVNIPSPASRESVFLDLLALPSHAIGVDHVRPGIALAAGDPAGRWRVSSLRSHDGGISRSVGAWARASAISRVEGARPGNPSQVRPSSSRPFSLLP